MVGEFEDMQKIARFFKKKCTPVLLITLILCLSFSIRTVSCEELQDNKALANFKEAGLSEYIDARLADAHELVEKLKGPLDFVFSDADKDWYQNYFMAPSSFNFSLL
jgi:predicted O-methyltransferase YrrM